MNPPQPLEGLSRRWRIWSGFKCNALTGIIGADFVFVEPFVLKRGMHVNLGELTWGILPSISQGTALCI